MKKCPFTAIAIVNLPKDLGRDVTHRFGPNAFKLHRLPMPRTGQVLGLVGTNGIGKSTALKILSGKLKPNLGRFDSPPDWKEILEYFRGSELQNYFTRLLEGKLKALIKPQYVDTLPKQIRGSLRSIIEKKSEADNLENLIDRLDLRHLLDRQISELSGGELQRFAVLATAMQRGDVYMFDEPSSYLDIKQRLQIAQVIRSLVKFDNYVVVVEHDLSVLDYLSDFICCLWGSPSHYGVVTTPFNVRDGINIFLDGFVPTENLRFRDESLNFRLAQETEEIIKRANVYTYPELEKKLGTFRLQVQPGNFNDSEIIVMLGQNGTGKSTFIRMLAGLLAPDNTEEVLPRLGVSYKPQTIAPKFDGTVRELLSAKIAEAYRHPQFITDVVKPMEVERLADLNVQNLSGGELQRVALVLALGKPADIYLLDEPSAYLDSEQRVTAARVIKRFILHAKKTAFIVEHDFIMATYLADRVVVYEGEPGVDCVALAPEPLVTGMNRFLKELNITFRRDPTSYRPRINKHESVKDKEQKLSGNYFHIEED